MKIPRKLYHAAPECVAGKIFEDGLRSNFGEIYAAESPSDALTFMWFRLLDHPHYEVVNGEPKVSVERHDAIHVWEIDTSKTEHGKWSAGTDHSTKFFGDATSWVYGGKNISASAVQCYTYSRQDIESAVLAK